MNIGQMNSLRVLRDTSVGIFLGDENGLEVLLPNKYVPENIRPDAMIDVFIYRDSEDRLIATTLEPYIMLHEFACLDVVDVTEYGAFLNWGLEKDLFVPFREQKAKMEVGKRYPVYLYLDEVTDRLTATGKYDRYLERDDINLERGAEVDILVTHFSDLGANVIINGLYKGLIHFEDLYRELELGERLVAYVKNLKENNQIDIMLQRPGFAHVEESSESILLALRSNKGFLPLHDKSSPEEIAEYLQMSKKTFKKALGILYKQRLVRLESDGVHLIK